MEEHERIKFQETLRKASTGEIKRGLEKDLFAREWKQDMAEAELARRESSSSQKLYAQSASSSKSHKAAALKSWTLAIGLIVVILLGASMFVLERM